MAKDAQGAEIGTKAWGDDVELGHSGAIAHLIDFLQGSAPITNSSPSAIASCTAA